MSGKKWLHIELSPFLWHQLSRVTQWNLLKPQISGVTILSSWRHTQAAWFLWHQLSGVTILGPQRYTQAALISVTPDKWCHHFGFKGPPQPHWFLWHQFIVVNWKMWGGGLIYVAEWAFKPSKELSPLLTMELHLLIFNQGIRSQQPRH